MQFAAWLHLVQCIWILIASLLGSEFSLETILQIQRDFLTIPAMDFKASTIKAIQQDASSMYLLVQWFPATNVHQHFLDSVKSRVFLSGRGSYTSFNTPSEP